MCSFMQVISSSVSEYAKEGHIAYIVYYCNDLSRLVTPGRPYWKHELCWRGIQKGNKVRHL